MCEGFDGLRVSKCTFATISSQLPVFISWNSACLRIGRPQVGNMQSVQSKDLARLNQILEQLGEGTDAHCEMLREHLQGARASLVGSMPAEYALSLNMAADALNCVSDQKLRTRSQDFIQGK